jgi:L-amino acid N-acyltransferase
MITLKDCNYDAHASSILEIFNDAILNSTALYEYKPRTMDVMRTWFEIKAKNNWPVLGAFDEAGALLGFASWGSFRAFPANKYTVEHSVYIEKNARGQGISKLLMKEILQRAEAANLHTLIGGIDTANEVSIALHEQLGFTHAGTIRHAAFKFGRWLDLAFYQLILPTPLEPLDG